MMMILLKLFAYVFLAYGLTEIVIYGRGPFGICEKWREFAHRVSDGFGELFTCPMCFSTWVGIVLSIIDITLLGGFALTPFNIIFSEIGNGILVWIATVLFDAMFTSGIVWLLFKLEDWLTGEKIQYVEDEYLTDESNRENQTVDIQNIEQEDTKSINVSDSVKLLKRIEEIYDNKNE